MSKSKTSSNTTMSYSLRQFKYRNYGLRSQYCDLKPKKCTVQSTEVCADRGWSATDKGLCIQIM